MIALRKLSLSVRLCNDFLERIYKSYSYRCIFLRIILLLLTYYYRYTHIARANFIFLRPNAFDNDLKVQDRHEMFRMSKRLAKNYTILPIVAMARCEKTYILFDYILQSPDTINY